MTRVGLIAGEGIGPEITAAAQRVMAATGVDLTWEPVAVGAEAMRQFGHPLPEVSVERLRALPATLKGPLIVNKLEGRLSCRQADGTEVVYPSLNNALRRELGLYVNPRPIRGYAGLKGSQAGLDVVIMREITEDIYLGLERREGDDWAEAIKRITRGASERVARHSFEYARRHGRKRVTCLHKANVLNYTDGLFLRCFREVALEYAEIPADDLMIDAACYRIVRDPERFDVVVCTNQYGDIFSDLAAGLAGSLGLAPGANLGPETATFEASHGAAPDIAGQGVANPMAMILCGAMMLKHLGELEAGAAVERAVAAVVEQGEVLPRDLGGTAGTLDVAEAVARAVEGQHSQLC